MKILLTNDDGFHADGLQALIETLKGEHELYVIAPKHHMSGMGHAISVGRDIAVEKQYIDGVKAAYTVTGTPSDCGKIAHVYLFKDIAFDLVVSGINRGLNLAADIIYSGTVSAAHESWAYGFNAIALSQDLTSDGNIDHMHAAEHAKEIINALDIDGEPFLYSINYPADGRPKDLIYATASDVKYREHTKISGDDDAFTIKFRGERINLSGCSDNEYDLIKKGNATIYPVKISVYPKERDNKIDQLIKFTKLVI